MSSLADRRFYNYVKEWRVGVSSDLYSTVGEDSGLGPVSWMPGDPYVRIPIPGGSVSVFQLIGNYFIEGRLDVQDYEAVTQLLKTIDVSATPGVQTAMPSFSRNTIGYFCIVIDNTKIERASDDRTAETSSFVFANPRIRRDLWNMHRPTSPVTVEWYADSVTQTDT